MGKGSNFGIAGWHMGDMQFSEYLSSLRPFLREAVGLLSKRFEYVSFLCTDCAGRRFQVVGREARLEDSPWGERGIVVRAQKGGRIAEYSFNSPEMKDLESFADSVSSVLQRQFSSDESHWIPYPLVKEEKASSSYRSGVRIDPSSADPKAVLNRLAGINSRIRAVSNEIVQARSIAEFVGISKLFVSPKRDLDQVYLWSQAYATAFARRGEVSKMDYASFSGKKGLEILDEAEESAIPLAREALSLLDAGKAEPGEYEVICAPDVAGVLAHEAFGHGVEMDMFVKERAKAEEYMGKAVGSSVVSMYDGSAAAMDEVAGYFFDDEGSVGGNTLIIDNGILKGGLTDSLSSLALRQSLTGNGRRESYERKAYARMSNTFFGPGKDSLEGMIGSIRKGYLLEKINSGMEDPKNWGIQVIAVIGREIVDGRLTGKLISPVIMSGYVPDVLGAVTMVSGELEFSGSGMCGKGHKEYVKVSSGGPYMKTRMRLG